MVGLVLYISSINDEMLNRTKDAETYFSYKYGWSFAFAAISFLLTEVTLPAGWVGSGVLPGLSGRRKTLYTHPGAALCPQNASVVLLVSAPSRVSQSPASAPAAPSLPTPAAVIAVSRAEPWQ